MLKAIFFCAACALLFAVVFCNDGDDNAPVVATKTGFLRGKFLESRAGRRIYSFTGIPFAEPPLGRLRFEPPVPANKWEDIRNATEIHESCPQRNIYVRSKDIVGNEDCLYLNVYTPQLDNKAKALPVMIFFHGGGWLCGAGSTPWYGPQFLVDKNVVLVVPNYRLGPLGFLTTGDSVVPGNNALKDQTLALKWIQANIASFGGDPNSVTIFGESAGGASVEYHLVSPLSNGLFHKAISQSGTAFCNWAFSLDDQVLTNSKKLAKEFDCPTAPSEKMVECLRQVDALEFIAKDVKFMEWDTDPMIPFRPVIEPKTPGAFLAENPEDIIKSGRSAQVPWITGINTEDGTLRAASIFGNPHLLEELDENFEKVAPISLFVDHVKDPVALSRKIRQFYFEQKKIDNTTREGVVDMYTDSWFLSGLDDAVRLHLAHTKAPVYIYLYGYRGSESFSFIFGDPDHNYGVCHADELMHLFPISFNPAAKRTSTDEVVTDFLTTLWTNFAATGDPTPEWTPATGEDMEYYYIDTPDKSKMQKGLYAHRAKFWRSLPLNYKRNTIRIKDEL